MKKSLISAAVVATTAVTIFAYPGLLKQEAGERVILHPAAPAQALDPGLSQKIEEIKTADAAVDGKASSSLVCPSGATLQGFLAYDESEERPLGWYTLTPSGEMELQWVWESQLSEAGLSPRGGWFRRGMFCTHAVASYGGDQQLFGSMYLELDPKTGALQSYTVVDVYENPFSNIISPVYVESEDKIYGFAIAPDGSKYSFVSAPAGDLNEAVEIKRLASGGERCYALAYNQDEDCFYGVNFFDKLVKVEKDGTQTEICAVPFSGLSGTRGGFVYSPLDGCYFYNPQFYENPSAIYAVYPAEKKFVLLNQFDSDMQFVTFHTPDNAAVTAESPKAPVVKQVDFTPGSNQAKVTYTLPSKTFGNTAMSGNMAWKACVNGREIASGNGAAGADVAVEFKNLDNGFQALQLFVTAGGITPNPAANTVFAGYDSPAKPTNVKLTDTKVSWTRVRRGEHNEHFDASDVTYTVFVNGENKGTTTGTSLDINLDANKPVAAYTAEVVAKAHDIASKPGVSNKIVFGAPMPLPFNFAPTADDFDLMSTFNLDGGAAYGEWSYSERWDRPCFASGWSKDIDANDWLILPGASFNDTDKAYRFALEAACGGMSGKEEFFEVWLGTAPDPAAMTIPVIGKTQVRSMEWEAYSNLFGVPAGTYYVGIHAVSKPNQYSLNVSNIKVEETAMSVLGPEAAESLEVVSVDNGKLTATVEFILPTKYLNGTAIPAGTAIEATVATSKGSAKVNGAAGSKASATVPTVQGDNAISVTCAIGNNAGASTEVMVFTGVDMADYVENLNAVVSEDNMSLVLTWEAPLKGLNDGYFERSGIEYYVGEVDANGEFTEDPRLAGKDVYSYTYSLDPGFLLSYHRIAVVACNAAGISNARWFKTAIIGEPHTLPMDEEFAQMTTKYAPISTQAPTEEYANGAWDWGQPELVDPLFNHGAGDFALIGYTDEPPARVRLSLPKFSTVGCPDATVVLDIWGGVRCPAEVKVYASTYGVDPVLIGTVPKGITWVDFKMTLPEQFLNRPWVNLFIDGKLNAANNYLVLSGYKITSTSGVESVADDADNDAPVEYFNLQGVKVDAPANGIYLRRQGAEVTKVVIR